MAYEPTVTLSKSSTLTKHVSLVPHGQGKRVSIHAFDRKRPCFFWIKSSAKRAFGGCLGSKRR